MAKETENGQQERSIDYAPEWMTKSIDKVPPSEGPLTMNPVVEQVVGISEVSNENGGQPSQPTNQSQDDATGKE